MRVKPELTIGPYEIEQWLSEDGATAEVALARTISHPDGQVVLKCARAKGRNRHLFHDSIRQEVAVLRALDHPGIVKIHPICDLSDAAGQPVYTARVTTLPDQPWYYVMDYLPGLSLAQHREAITRSFPLSWRFQLFHQLFDSLVYLHKMGYIHGDLKPDHVLFRRLPDPSQEPQAVLIDFGAAFPIDGLPQYVVASPPYAAPELTNAMRHRDALGNLHPAQLDTWALGTVGFELFTGAQFRLVPPNRQPGQTLFDAQPGIAHLKLPPDLRRLLTMMLNPEERSSILDLQHEQVW